MRTILQNTFNKLQKLEKLVHDTDKMYEEKQGEENQRPFSSDAILLQTNLGLLQDYIDATHLHNGRYSQDIDSLTSSQRKEIASAMLSANHIWETRKAVLDGDLEIAALDNTATDLQCLDYIKKNQKINAIKHHRSKMKEIYRKDVTLKESKEYVDNLALKYNVSKEANV